MSENANQTSEQLLEFTRTISRLERELEALEQSRFSDRLDSEALGRLLEAVQNGQEQQTVGHAFLHSTAQENRNLTEGGKSGNLNSDQSIIENIFGDVLKNGVADKNRLKENAYVFNGKSAEDIDAYLSSLGYSTSIEASTRKGSKARIIRVLNDSSDRNISQIQVSPGGRRHGINPYLKISTTNQEIIKIIFGDPNTYKSDGMEKAFIIFAEVENHD